MNVNELIQIAWRNSTLIDEEEEPTTSEASAGLRLFNSMLRALNVKPWWPVTRTEIQFKMTGKPQYTIGNYNIDEGTITNTDPSEAYVTVADTSKYTVGSFVNVRYIKTPQSTNDEVEDNFYVEVQSITSSTTMILDSVFGNIPATPIYITPTGEIPDIVTFRPSDLAVVKYMTGNTWVPVQEKTLATWDSESDVESSSTYPSKYRYLPSVPYATIDFGNDTTSDLIAFISYKSKISEVTYDTILEEVFPPEYISAFEYMLASHILVANNRTEPTGVFAIANSRKKELMRNNVDVQVLEDTNRKPWYDYRRGRNIYG